ncbi:MAG: hypothetical protein BroJett014_11180 [Planctomycetota bacterium]|nr:hypothetical protein [Planctomycetota bacterium]GIK52145.1 MAG: hypothetical protein BroJett014_11180 [Planctomycetota bacterium]
MPAKLSIEDLLEYVTMAKGSLALLEKSGKATEDEREKAREVLAEVQMQVLKAITDSLQARTALLQKLNKKLANLVSDFSDSKATVALDSIASVVEMGRKLLGQ